MCGCGGGNGSMFSDGAKDNAPGVLLSGTLDGQYAGLPGGSQASGSDNSQTVVSADVTGGISGGAWVIGLFFLLGVAWYLDRTKKDQG